MPAAKSIIGQCHLCCDPTLSSVVIEGWHTTSSVEVSGWVGFDDGSYDPAHPENWNGWGKLWRRRSNSGERLILRGPCTDCESPVGNSGIYNVFFGGYEDEAEPDSFFTHEVHSNNNGPSCVPDTISQLNGSNIDGSENIHRQLTRLTASYEDRNCAPLTGGSFVETGEGVQELSIPVAPPIPTSGTAGMYECSTSTLGAVSTYPCATEPPYHPCGRGEIESPQRTSARRLFTLRGQPLTTYLVTLTMANSLISGGALADSVDELEVTTDEDGVAEWEHAISQPPPGQTRCYSGVYTITPA